MTVYRNNRDKWTVDIEWTNPDGSVRRIRKTSPVQTRVGAERYEREIRNALNDGTYGIVRDEDVPTVAQFEDTFLGWYANSDKKASSINRRRELLKDHVLPLFGNRRMNDFGMKQELELKARLAGRKSKSTYNCAAATINKLLQAAKATEMMSCEPFQFSYFPRGPGRPHYYNHRQLDLLIEAATKFGTLALCLVLLGTDAGFRRGEMFGLDGAHVNLDTGKVEIWEAEYIIGEKRNADTPKGGVMRALKMTPRLRTVLKKRISEVGYGRLFVNRDGSQMTNWDMRSLMKGIQEAAGLKQTGSLHVLRHTFGSHMALAGVPMLTIQKLMGHATIQSTMVYLHLAPGDADSGIDRLDSARRQPGGNGNGKNAGTAENMLS